MPPFRIAVLPTKLQARAEATLQQWLSSGPFYWIGVCYIRAR